MATRSRLETYESKRDFARTPEPRGAPGRSRRQLQYVIQRHDARKLHYDLRLEHAGVLKSWAVPKGPSLKPGERRLAVQTEDHPLDYASFEGEIPEGPYGAGSVLIWDRGYWQPEGDPDRGLAEGKLDFEIHGERLNGHFVLVRLATRDSRSRPAEWLLMKHDKKRGTRSQAASVPLGKRKRKEGATLRDLKGARSRPLPPEVLPQLATAVARVPDGPDWVFEPKLDGFRVLCRRGPEGIAILTRGGRDWTMRFPGIAEGALQLPCDSAILDGEAVVLDRRGLSDFQRLQKAIAAGDERIVFVAFDLLYLDGYDLRDVPLERRKALLERLLDKPPPAIRYGEHVQGPGPEFLREACRLGLEGIIAKRAGDSYRAGRTRSWLKVKCIRRQEFVVVGFTKPAGTRSGFGALLLATRDSAGAPLRYAGKVGTGFDRRTLADLRARLEPLRRKGASIADAPPRIAREALWVVPRLVAEIAFSEWTDDGRLRHPRFKGLRDDKMPAEVVAERPIDNRNDRRERLTHPDKVLFPDDGITKRELAEYWQAVADHALPLMRERPLMLLRCPEGHGAQCFYQKHVGISMPDSVPRVMVSADEEPYSMVDSLPALLGLVQIAAIELHAWGSRADRLEHPDIIVLDLDPDEDLEWKAVVAAAFELKARLEDLGLVPFLRVTGGKGLHVVVPVVPGPRWPAVKKFARAVADEMARAAPQRFTTSVSKRRRRGRIFIDYLRTDRGSTAIASYSPRARAGAPVALPIDWREIESPGQAPPRFGLRDVPSLVARRVDPWRDFEASRRSLTD